MAEAVKDTKLDINSYFKNATNTQYEDTSEFQKFHKRFYYFIDKKFEEFTSDHNHKPEKAPNKKAPNNFIDQFNYKDLYNLEDVNIQQYMVDKDKFLVGNRYKSSKDYPKKWEIENNKYKMMIMYNVPKYDQIFEISNVRVDNETSPTFQRNKNYVYYEDYKKIMIQYLSNNKNISIWRRRLAMENEKNGFIKGSHIAGILFPLVKEYTNETTLRVYMSTLLIANYLNMVIFPIYNYLPVGSVFYSKGSPVTKKMNEKEIKIFKTYDLIASPKIEIQNRMRAGDEKSYKMIMRT